MAAGDCQLPAGPRQFATTQWSIVLAARGAEEPAARDALASLCEAYWYPWYAYIRRAGHSADAAQDLTQEFFTRLLERDFLAALVHRRLGLDGRTCTGLRLTRPVSGMVWHLDSDDCGRTRPHTPES